MSATLLAAGRRKYLGRVQSGRPSRRAEDRPVYEELSFAELLARVRTGDADAETELVDRYGDAVRRVARYRIRRSRLTHRLDSVDILQSVMKSFMIRYARTDNPWRIDTPEQLVNLLLDMTGKSVIDKKRGEMTAKRGGGVEIEPIITDPRARRNESPVDIAITRELAALCLEKLSADGRRLFHLRFEKQLEWSAIAALEKSTAEACRNKFNRALEAVRGQMPSEVSDG
jgi:DNA-directed RNA polymerase specialized sigma24 family protein